MLEDEVDEKYFLTQKGVASVVNRAKPKTMYTDIDSDIAIPLTVNEEIHCIRLFNIYGATGGNYAGNVYDIEGIAPVLNDMRGGNRQPLIETKKIIVGGGRRSPEDKECEP